MELFVGNKNYSSWSLRPWLVLTELAIPFEERLVAFGSSDWSRVRAVSPTGKVPCLRDGAIVVWDSLAIVEYLAEREARVWPSDRAARAFARSAAAEMHSSFGELRSRCAMSVGVRVRLGAIPPALRADLDRLDALFADGLARFGGPFLAGASFSAVDAFFAPVAFRAQTYHLPFAPASLDYLARLRDLAGMKRWYADGLAETFRDPPHDVEVAAGGELVADLRAEA